MNATTPFLKESRARDHACRFSFTDPYLEVITHGNLTWFLSGMAFCPDTNWRARASHPDFETQLCEKWQDVLVTRFEYDTNGHLVEVRAWKGLASSYEFYYTDGLGSEFAIADNFQGICAAVPQEHRRVSDAALVDYLLFRAATNTQSFLQGIKRLGHGSMVALSGRGKLLKEVVFQQVLPPKSKRSIADYQAEVDQCLEQALSGVREEPRVATLFTGGVDSTLVQTHMRDRSVPLNLKPECGAARWSFQTDYAKNAANLLGLDLLEVPVSNERALDGIVDAIQLAGLPQRSLYTLLWPSALKSDHDVYLTGERADAFFKGGSVKTAMIANVLRTIAPFMVGGDKLPAWCKSPRAKSLWRATGRLGKNMAHPYGFLGLRCCEEYCDIPWLMDIFGQTLVEERLLDRITYTLDRIETSTISTDSFWRKVVLGDWTGIWSNEDLARMRQIAHGLGKTVYAPFSTGPLVRASMEIPPQDRYVHNGTSKYILKGLLGQRLPGYPTHQTKGLTGLDFESLYMKGPLSNVWNTYDMPDFVPQKDADALRKMAKCDVGATQLPQYAWSIVNYAIWQQEILTPRRKVAHTASNDNHPQMTLV